MKIAIITPLPPQHTGIADYAADLIAGLSNNPELDLTLISNAGIERFHTCPVHSPADITDAEYRAFDLIIYQVGNSCEFHGYMLDLLKKFGGILHLHDIVLHNLFAALFIETNRPDDYFRIIQHHYGTKTLEHIKHELSCHRYPWESPAVIDMPLFEEFVRHCDGCIVHSDFAKNRIHAAFPDLDIYKIKQVLAMDIHPPAGADNDILRFGIFGGVDPHKKTDVVLKVLNTIKTEHPDIPFLLTISGKISSPARTSLDSHLDGVLKNCVRITGRVDQKTFLEYLAETDILIALRYPTMGETSGVVMRALQLGIPCIVNDTGWFSELPDHVMKIPVVNMEEALKSTLLNICEREKLTRLKEQALAYSREKLDFTETVRKYSDIIHTAHSNTQNSTVYHQLALTMNDLTYTESPEAFSTAVEKLMDVF